MKVTCLPCACFFCSLIPPASELRSQCHHHPRLGGVEGKSAEALTKDDFQIFEDGKKMESHVL